MNAKLTLTAVVATALLAAWSNTVLADEQQADCDVREHGEKKKGQSGPCLFSQRQGYIDIRLNNGKSYSLSPQDKANTFKDQEGRTVKRTEASGNTHKYKWEHRNITVTFTGGSSDYAGHSGHGASHGSGNAIAIDLMDRGGVERTDYLEPGDTMRYEFKAADGRDLYVRVAPHGSSLTYQIFNPDGSFLLEQISSDKEYRGQLWQSGRYVVEVINRNNHRASYNVIMSLD